MSSEFLSRSHMRNESQLKHHLRALGFLVIRENVGFTLSLVVLRQKEREKSTAANIFHTSNTIIWFQFSDVITMTSYSFETKKREMV